MLYRAMRAMDIYLNPNMGPYPKKDKSEIIYVDLVEDSDEARSIDHTDSGTSPGEFNEVSHMTFMTKPELFGIQSGDEQWHDEKGRFKIIKIEPESNQESDEEATDGIETVVEDETGPEEGEVVIIPILKPTKNVKTAQGQKSVTKDATRQENAPTETGQETATPSTSKGNTTTPHRTDLERRSFQIALAADTLDDDGDSTVNESDSASDSNTPRRVLRRNIKEVLRKPEVLTTLLRHSIKTKLVIRLQSGEKVVVGEDW
jgi:hypothetical protein